MSPRPIYVYILASRSRVLYVGVTNDVRRRLAEHRAGTGSAFTRRYRVRQLVYVEEHAQPADAICREKEIKAWRREKKVGLIESVNPDWEDLSEAESSGPTQT